MRPPGAVMRLTASRQPYDITNPKNSRHTKTIPYLQNYSFPPLFYYCKPTSANTEKCGSTGPHREPYGGALETTYKPAHPNPLHEPTTLKLRTFKFPVFPHTATNNLPSRIPMPTKAYQQTEASHALKPDGRIQLRDKRKEIA